MFELADRLVGIYKTYNCTKTVTINPYLLAGLEQPSPAGGASQANPRPPAASQPVQNGSVPSKMSSLNGEKGTPVSVFASCSVQFYHCQCFSRK